MNPKVQTESADIEIRPDGIMHIHIKVESTFEMKNSMEIIEARTKLAQNKIYPILYTASEFVLPSREVREYVASESRSALVSADAFVINNLPQRLIASLYKKYNKPVRPTRVFSCPEKAIKWLKQYVK